MDSTSKAVLDSVEKSCDSFKLIWREKVSSYEDKKIGLIERQNGFILTLSAISAGGLALYFTQNQNPSELLSVSFFLFALNLFAGPLCHLTSTFLDGTFIASREENELSVYRRMIDLLESTKAKIVENPNSLHIAVSDLQEKKGEIESSIKEVQLSRSLSLINRTLFWVTVWSYFVGLILLIVEVFRKVI